MQIQNPQLRTAMFHSKILSSKHGIGIVLVLSFHVCQLFDRVLKTRPCQESSLPKATDEVCPSIGRNKYNPLIPNVGCLG